jgi:hypothetical protein
VALLLRVPPVPPLPQVTTACAASGVVRLRLHLEPLLRRAMAPFAELSHHIYAIFEPLAHAALPGQVWLAPGVPTDLMSFVIGPGGVSVNLTLARSSAAEAFLRHEDRLQLAGQTWKVWCVFRKLLLLASFPPATLSELKTLYACVA